MIASIFKGLGRLALLAATAAMLVAASLFLLGSYLLTWPILRKSPRNRTLTAAMDLAAAGMTMMAVLQKQAEELDTLTDSNSSTPKDT